MYTIGQTVLERRSPGGTRDSPAPSHAVTIDHIYENGDIETSSGLVYNRLGMSNDDSYRSIRSTDYPGNK